MFKEEFKRCREAEIILMTFLQPVCLSLSESTDDRKLMCSPNKQKEYENRYVRAMVLLTNES